MRSDGEQFVGQSADYHQDAKAIPATIQEKPSNNNISVRVLSPGNDGGGHADERGLVQRKGRKPERDKAVRRSRRRPVVRACRRSANRPTNDQDAFALGLTVQKGASNENTPVRVLSPGDSWLGVTVERRVLGRVGRQQRT